MAKTARIIDGKAFAARLRQDVAAGVAALAEERRVTPGLAVVLVGENPASEVYVRNKSKHAQEVGMAVFDHPMPASATHQAVLAKVEALNADAAVHGILVQLPLPDQVGERAVLAAVKPAKDVDGFHVINAGRLMTGEEGMMPCTPFGCLLMLKDTLGDLKGKRALVLGRSNIVGKPMAMILLREHCTVTVAHSRTQDLAGECRRADILVVAAGRPEMVRGDWIKPGARRHRRRHQPHPGRRRQDAPGRRRLLPRGGQGRGRHHPGPRWRRPHDHRLSAAEYPDRRTTAAQD